MFLMSGFVRKNKNAVILVVCILLHTVVLYGICNFRKSIETYGDELLYYSIARSLFLGQGIMVHGVPSHFQNLAYSFYLMPFFYISNGILRMKVITLANSFLISLSVIPVWFLCKELKLKEKLIEMSDKEKIKLSDAILVVNVNNYIGNSTKSEIEFAKSLNKEVMYYTDLIE